MHHSSSRRFVTKLALLAAPAWLSACTEAPTPSLEALASTIRDSGGYFKLGRDGNKSPVLVLFDPRCPHCAELWKVMRANPLDRSYLWAPLALIGHPASAPQAAAILAAASPVDAMDKHEATLSPQGGGISADRSDKAARLEQTVKQNTKLALAAGVSAVPCFLLERAGKATLVPNLPSWVSLQAELNR